jgi:hypothetical protein
MHRPAQRFVLVVAPEGLDHRPRTIIQNPGSAWHPGRDDGGNASSSCPADDWPIDCDDANQMS